MKSYIAAIPLSVTASLLLVACAPSQPDGKQDAGAMPPIKATAQLVNAQGVNSGTAILTEDGTGLKLLVQASGLASGTYGIHLHSVGKCEGPKFESAGSHWNPSAKQHGLENPLGTHSGDLPNIEAVAGKTTEYTREIKGAALSKGEMAVLDSDGTAIMIHAKPDDYKTDPSGNSGDRIICGVFSLG